MAFILPVSTDEQARKMQAKKSLELKEKVDVRLAGPERRLDPAFLHQSAPAYSCDGGPPMRENTL